MFPKKNRLSKTAEVNLTTAKGRTFFSLNFLIKYIISPQKNPPLLTVVVSNKVSKSAVVRNRIKRLIRTAVQKEIINIKPGWYVFIAKKQVTQSDPKELMQEVNSALRKSKIIHNG